MRHAEFEDIDQLLREAGDDPQVPGQDWLQPPLRERFQRWKCDIVKTVRERTDARGLQHWVQQDISRQSVASEAAWVGNPQRVARWALAQRDRFSDQAEHSMRLPQGVDAQLVLPFLKRSSESSPARLRLMQHGAQLAAFMATAVDSSVDATRTPPIPVFELAAGDASGTELTVKIAGTTANAPDSWIVPMQARMNYLPLRLDSAVGAVTIDTGAERLVVEPLTLRAFPWAAHLRRDATGLHLFGPDWLGQAAEFLWVPPDSSGPGAWKGSATDSRVGVDEFGLYAELPVGRTTQRFRWIVPGTFQMGSPATEKERLEDETQHAVTLTKGYWLADTTVTQALWLEVMGSNPSRFTGEAHLPVDSVSWDDAQMFIARLNERVPGLMAGLPSEAQWEYACRAGTETPFSFGETITPEQVNYDGNYPYGKARKGLYRQRPVPVGSLPANRWGLYEMHGNVWEWCSDWYEAYGRGPQRDPEGPPMGSDRVLRGGSWIYGAGNARSAQRSAGVPGHRNDLIGFRLAPGRMGAGPAERGEAGRGRSRGTREEPSAGGARRRPSEQQQKVAKKKRLK